MHARAGFPESFTHWLISAARGPTKNHGFLAMGVPPRPAARLADRIGRPQGQDERPHTSSLRAGLAPRPRVASSRPATGRLRKPWLHADPHGLNRRPQDCTYRSTALARGLSGDARRRRNQKRSSAEKPPPAPPNCFGPCAVWLSERPYSPCTNPRRYRLSIT